ncbi:isochorismatase family protein [Psychromonas aquatilis]|uniref:Isochorismatase family protein n=1 Tax=Psychromonas aquatilis TaxID=2005072 RepID=A0ABU9GM12_9GAMM
MLDKQNTGLIIVDIQGKLANTVYQHQTLITNYTKLIKGALVLNIPLICLEQNPLKLGPTVEPLQALLKNVPTISKFTFNGCAEEKFVTEVKQANVETWLICGIESHICVYQTALGLVEIGYQVQLVHDCISSRTQNNNQLGINKLTAHGVELSGLEMCLYELVKDCRAPEFKRILNLIK